MFKQIWQSLFAKPSPSEKEDPTMKYLIVGLGNIGLDYEDTRHNIGFNIVETLAESLGASFAPARQGALATCKHKGRSLFILKPSTYMNLSGQAVRYWLQKENIPIENLLVILDDLNLEFGTVRIKGKGSPGGHNGLKNIEQILGHNNYSRVRVGIGSRFGKGGQVGFVLGKWSEEENEHLPTIEKHCAAAALSFALAGLDITMNQYNKQLLPPIK